MKPSIGRIVHFVQKKPTGYGEGMVHVPAIVVAVWGPECVNLQVFCDGSNSEDNAGGTTQANNTKWITSATYDASDTPQPRTWHWPERE